MILYFLNRTLAVKMYPIVSSSLMLLMIFQCLITDATNQYYVRPTAKWNNCPSPCFLFKSCLKQPNNCFKSDTVLQFLPGKYFLNRGLLLSNINNISLFAMYNQTAVFLCNKKRSYIAFNNSTTVNMENIVFNSCGAVLRNIMPVTALPVTLRKVLASAVVFYNCDLFQLSNISYEDIYGHGLIIINAKKSFVINNTFSHSRYLEDENTIFAGILVYFEKLPMSNHQINVTAHQTEQILLTFQNCQFINYGGFTEDDLLRVVDHTVIAKALSLIIYEQKDKITINILNTTFVNCTCFGDPLIKVLFSYYGSTHIHFKDTKLFKNLGRIAVHVKIIFQGERISFVNDAECCGHKLHFQKCHMHGNKMFRLIQLDFTAADRKTISQLKVKLPFDLYITESTFIRNAISGLWHISATNIALLTTITIRNSNFILNKNMLIEFYYIRKIIFCGQNIFSNNTANSSLIIIRKSDSYFSGVTKFMENSITGSSIMTINNYTTLLVNASLLFDSNYLNIIQPANSSLHPALISSEFCREEYCPCAIQFRNLKKNDTKVDINKFSLIFENNIASNHDPKILYGKNLRDCFWLPGTLFPNEHPGEFFQSIIQYNGNNVNPSGYPYNLCLCQESINCLVDGLFDDGIYPGQILNFSFILVDTISKHFKTSLSVAPIQDVKTAPCIVEHSQIHQLVTTECSPVIYTLSVSNENNRECSIQLQYEVEFPVLSVYYVRILPCPPGFIFFEQKCQCHPALQYVTPHPTCCINEQSVYRPENSWLSFSVESNEILYTEICPFQNCLQKHSFIQLLHPDTQCDHSRTGVLCGECLNGLSSVFGSSKCKKCSNVWLASILMFSVAGLLLVFLLFLSKTTIKDGSINGFVLYVNIVSINSYNIFASDSNITRSFAYVITSLANLDLGFDLCFYDGMTEYSKTWLQLAFPLYLLCLTQLIIQISRHIQKLTKLTGKNTISVLATLLLLSYNKILLVSFRGLFFYTQVTSLQSRKKETFWSIDISVPLFGVKFFFLFIVCLILLVAIIIPLNLTLLLPKMSYRIKYVHYFKPLLDVYHGAFKDNHRYWFGLELVLRVMIFGVTALENKISLLVNVLILAGVVAYLCYVQPFNSLKNSLLEWSFLMNAIVLLMLTFYYGQHKTKTYFNLLNFMIVMAFVEFVGIILCYI